MNTWPLKAFSPLRCRVLFSASTVPAAVGSKLNSGMPTSTVTAAWQIAAMALSCRVQPPLDTPSNCSRGWLLSSSVRAMLALGP